MKKILTLVFVLAVVSARAQTAISASNITDAFGHPVAVAKLCFVPVDASKSPAGFRVGSTQVVPNEACANVGAGVLESGKSVVPTTSGINYHVYLKQSFSNAVIRDYGFTPITGGAWSLDSFDPTVSVTTALSPPLSQGVGVPSSCTAPSVWLQTDSPQLYTCRAGSYVSILTVGPAGPSGSVSLPQLATAAGLPKYNTPLQANLLDPSRVVQGAAYANAGVVGNNGSSQFVTSYINVAGRTSVKANFDIGGGPVVGSSTYGPIFLQADLTLLSQSSSPVSKGSALSIPSGAAVLVVYTDVTASGFPGVNAMYLCDGTADVTKPQQFGYLSPDQTNVAITGALSNLVSVTARLPVGVNLFDKNKVVSDTVIDSTTGAVTTGFTGYVSTGFFSVQGLTSFVSNQNLGAFQQYGVAFYDALGNYMSGINGFGLSTPGHVFSVPTGASVARAWWPASQQTATLNTMIIAGGSTVPAYVDFPGNAIAQAPLPFAGVSYGHMGDSISYGLGSNTPLAPLLASTLGATLSLDLSWSGRYVYQALDNTGNTGVAYPTSSSVASLKVLSIWLGTNVNNTSNIGSATDAASVGVSNANGITFPSTDSFCSQMKGVIEQLLAWNPTLRIVWVTPYQSSHYNGGTASGYGVGVVPDATSLATLASITSAIKSVSALYSIPVVDMYSNSGINPKNVVALTVDSLHPTASTQKNRIAPTIAHALAGYAPN